MSTEFWRGTTPRPSSASCNPLAIMTFEPHRSALAIVGAIPVPGDHSSLSLLSILLCLLAIDLQRSLVFLPGFLHPVLLAVKHLPVVQHHRVG